MNLHTLVHVYKTPLAWFGPSYPCHEAKHDAFPIERTGRSAHYDCALKRLNVEAAWFCEHKCDGNNRHFFDRRQDRGDGKILCPDCREGNCPVGP